jgi:hypothetical protein
MGRIFPLTMVQALIREVSDHTPLLLSSSEPLSIATQHLFKFKLGWLFRDGFIDMIQNIWSNTKVGQTPMEMEG